jgi:LemA protein
MIGWLVFAVFVFGAVGSVLYVVGLYNGLVALKHAVDQAWSNIDVLLKQRHDEIPKLVDTVKGYIAHEREVLQRITEARTRFEQARSVDEKSAADGAMRGALAQLFAVAEAYPTLKADGSFQMLQERISRLEDGIADRREFYNHSVNSLNVRIEQLPDVFLARAMALSPRGLFQVGENEKRDVKIAF